MKKGFTNLRYSCLHIFCDLVCSRSLDDKVTRDVKASSLGLITSGLGLGTLWPQPRNLIAFSYGTWCPQLSEYAVVKEKHSADALTLMVTYLLIRLKYVIESLS